MKDLLFKVRGNVIYGTLLGSAIVAFLSITGLIITAPESEHTANMRIEPTEGQVGVGDTFIVDVIVESKIPVNVFKGEIDFDHDVLSVVSIDYNTSIANLWAELPWYENGDGTINFAGGTTRQGGFTGTGTLVTITFRTRTIGNTALHLHDTRILEHDGLGTDVAVEAPIDALFAVGNVNIDKETVAIPKTTTSMIAVGSARRNTDLNNDGRQSMADISIFMLNMFSDAERFDFNMDGEVDEKDLSIITSAR